MSARAERGVGRPGARRLAPRQFSPRAQWPSELCALARSSRAVRRRGPGRRRRPRAGPGVDCLKVLSVAKTKSR